MGKAGNVGYENHWSHFGGAPSINAQELTADHLGKDVAVMVGEAAAVGPLRKLAFKPRRRFKAIESPDWPVTIPSVKLTLGYDDQTITIVVEGDARVHLVEALTEDQSAAEVSS